MYSKVTSNLNWGRNTKIFSKVFFPKNINEIKVFAKKHNLIFSGNNRSFGDNSINPKLIVSTKNLNKILDYDKKSGLINVESGILLSEILKIIIADGWILPLMPGSKYVSVGGIIANNVHGKNSKNSQFGTAIVTWRLATLLRELPPWCISHFILKPSARLHNLISGVIPPVMATSPLKISVAYSVIHWVIP